MKFEEREVNLKVHTQAHHFGMNELQCLRVKPWADCTLPCGAKFNEVWGEGRNLVGHK